MAVDHSGDEWELIKINVDSGAIDTVGPKSIAQAFRARETPASRNGLLYRAANWTPIRNEGEKHIIGLTDDRTPINFVMKIAEVSKPLGSVYQFTEAGNMVVFDKGHSYIVDKRTGKKTKLIEENGVFYLHVWVPKNRRNENMFAEVQDSSRNSEGFVRQAVCTP